MRSLSVNSVEAVQTVCFRICRIKRAPSKSEEAWRPFHK